eukprot:1016762-Amphidinium_carterae.1
MFVVVPALASALMSVQHKEVGNSELIIPQFNARQCQLEKATPYQTGCHHDHSAFHPCIAGHCSRYGLLPVEDQMLMNETLMLDNASFNSKAFSLLLEREESTLPRGARHVSGSTMAADWLAECLRCESKELVSATFGAFVIQVVLNLNQ